MSTTTNDRGPSEAGAVRCELIDDELVDRLLASSSGGGSRWLVRVACCPI